MSVSGFDFDVDQAGGRAVQIAGDARDVLRRTVLVSPSPAGAQLCRWSKWRPPPKDESSVVQDSQMPLRSGVDGIGQMPGAGRKRSEPARVECLDCLFQGPERLGSYVNDGCRQLRLAHNVFCGNTDGSRDSIGLNVDYRAVVSRHESRNRQQHVHRRPLLVQPDGLVSARDRCPTAKRDHECATTSFSAVTASRGATTSGNRRSRPGRLRRTGGKAIRRPTSTPIEAVGLRR